MGERDSNVRRSDATMAFAIYVNTLPVMECKLRP